MREVCGVSQRYRNRAISNAEPAIPSSRQQSGDGKPRAFRLGASLPVFLLNQRLIVFVRQFQFAAEAAHDKVGLEEMY